MQKVVFSFGTSFDAPVIAGSVLALIND